MEVITKFKDIEARYRGNIETIELDNFRTSLSNIKRREDKIVETMRAKNAENIARYTTRPEPGSYKAHLEPNNAQQLNPVPNITTQILPYLPSRGCAI